MEPDDPFASNPAMEESAHGHWRYFALFGMQSVGAVVLYATGLILYRQTLADPTSHEAHPWTLVWSLLSIALMQCTYWVPHHLRPPLPQFRNTLLGHAGLFLARMGFVLPTSVFGFVFVAQRPEFDIPVFQCLVLFLGLPVLLRTGVGAPGSGFHSLRQGDRHFGATIVAPDDSRLTGYCAAMQCNRPLRTLHSQPEADSMFFSGIAAQTAVWLAWAQAAVTSPARHSEHRRNDAHGALHAWQSVANRSRTCNFRCVEWSEQLRTNTQ